LIVLDASGLFAALDRDEPDHEAARAALEADPGPLILSPFVLAELDYLLIRELGIEFELSVLREVAAGAYTLAPFDEDAVGEAEAVARRYADLRIGLADASAVVLAGRYGTNRILTLDERHFRALRTPAGEPFVVLPADG
jgi:predicted nucleic acid-binding protein